MVSEHTSDPTAPVRVTALTAGRGAPAAACAGLLVLFAALAWLAVSTKSATVDEVVHAPAAYTHLRYHDFRANPEHPPLWKYWAALPWLAYAPDVRVAGASFAAIPGNLNVQWRWGIETLYHTPGNDPNRLLPASRAMMLLLGVGLGAVVAYFGWRAGGGVAAVVAAGLFALDPNFLAHAPLVTNDVAFSLVAVALTYVLWRVGQQATWGRIAGLALLCGAAVTTKFTGLLAGPIVLVALAVRALMPEPWVVLGQQYDRRTRRLGAAAVLCAACAVVTYATIWAAYGFQSTTTPDPGVHRDMDQIMAEVVRMEIMSRNGGRAPTMEDIRAWWPGPFVRLVVEVGLGWHVLPEPFLHGLLFAYAKSLYRNSYLLGQISGLGHWYYFPVAILVKTPLATLAAGVLAAGVAAWLWTARRRDAAAGRGLAGGRWLWVCLGVAASVFGTALVRSHLNIGLRHALPLYPLAFVAIGVVAARVLERWPGKVRVVLSVLALGLAAESFGSFPHYLSYFNAAAGGARGGFGILGDSNLDWGQDLPLLAEWQGRHPGRTLHLAYFGTADPKYHGVEANLLMAGIDAPLTQPHLPTFGVVAVSATTLQGTWLTPEGRAFFEPLRGREPDWVLGGSIYLFDMGGR